MSYSDPKSIEWRTNWDAHFYHLTDIKADAIEEIVKTRVHHVTAGEIDTAIAVLCDNWKGQGSPTVKDIVQTIIHARAIHKHGSTGKDLSGYRRRIEMAHDGVDLSYMSGDSAIQPRKTVIASNSAEAIWGIICEPIDTSESKAIENWAIESRFKFDRDQVPFIAEMMARSDDVRCGRLERESVLDAEEWSKHGKAKAMPEPVEVSEFCPF